MAEASVRKSILVFNAEDSVVWYYLIKCRNGSMGVAEQFLLEQTKLPRQRLIEILMRLVDEKFILHRLQKIGTGGDCDHFYCLRGKEHELAVYYTPDPTTP